MNGRIKELYVRALSEAGEDGEATMVEKFAELIVKECAKVANDNFDKGFCPVGDFIKDHFGVK